MRGDDYDHGSGHETLTIKGDKAMTKVRKNILNWYLGAYNLTRKYDSFSICKKVHTIKSYNSDFITKGGKKVNLKSSFR